MMVPVGVLLRRFLLPTPIISVYAWYKWRAKVSMRAEVELSSWLTLGRGTVVSSFTKIKAALGPFSTGERCGFGTGCFIGAGAGGVVMGDNVILGPNVSVIASNYEYGKLNVPLEDQGHTSKGIRIGSNVWIGANSVILDGSVIGDNTIIAAGSIVNRRFPSGSILQGNPARILLRRSIADAPTEEPPHG
jgi:carbonic anhydrase/acetyltransferase-like protein (isoleucine patch superfamily)